MRICRVKATQYILEMQHDAVSGLLLQNAIRDGFTADDVEELEVDDAGYAAAKLEDPYEIAKEATIAAQREARRVKIQDFADNIPSWNAVDTAITNITNLADAKVFIKKLSRVVYWLARNQQD